MKYVYVPNNYDYDEINKKFSDFDEFIKVQIKCRSEIEKIIMSFLNFENIDNNLEQYNIPIIEDKEYNFYHKFSTFGSKYIYLRNNIHVERLDLEDINYIKKCIISNDSLSSDFIFKHLNILLFEKGDKIFLGPTNIENLVNSQSIIFEFSFDQIKCIDVEHLLKIENIYNNIVKYVKNLVMKYLKLPVSFIKYNKIPDLYKKNEKRL